MRKLTFAFKMGGTNFLRGVFTAGILIIGAALILLGVASAQEGDSGGNASNPVDTAYLGNSIVFKSPSWRYAVQCQGCSDNIVAEQDYIIAECPEDKECFLEWCDIGSDLENGCGRRAGSNLIVFGKTLIKLENFDETYAGQIAEIRVEKGAARKSEYSEGVKHGSIVMMPGLLVPMLERGDYITFNPPIMPQTIVETNPEIKVNIFNLKETKPSDPDAEIFSVCGYPFPDISRYYKIGKMQPSSITLRVNESGCSVDYYEIYPLASAGDKNVEMAGNKRFKYRCGDFYYFLKGSGREIDCIKSSEDGGSDGNLILHGERIITRHPESKFDMVLDGAELISYSRSDERMVMVTQSISSPFFSFGSRYAGAYEISKRPGIPIFFVLTPPAKRGDEPSIFYYTGEEKNITFALHDDRYILTVNERGVPYRIDAESYIPFAKRVARSNIGHLWIGGINLRIPDWNFVSDKWPAFFRAFPAKGKPYKSYCETKEDCPRGGECIKNQCVVVEVKPAIITKINRRCVTAVPGDSLTKILNSQGWASPQDVVIISKDGVERDPQLKKIRGKLYYFLDVGEKVCLKNNIEYSNERNTVKIFTEMIKIKQ